MGGSVFLAETVLPIVKWVSMFAIMHSEGKTWCGRPVSVAGSVQQFAPEAYCDWKIAAWTSIAGRRSCGRFILRREVLNGIIDPQRDGYKSGNLKPILLMTFF